MLFDDSDWKSGGNGDSLIELSARHRLYLKPVHKLTIRIEIPSIKTHKKKAISNWEILEKIHSLISPLVFQQLQVVSSGIDRIDLDGEVESRLDCRKIVELLENKRKNRLKISGFNEPFVLSASIAETRFPKIEDVERIRRESTIGNESDDRLDTLHIRGLPSLWFSDETGRNRATPSRHVVESVFGTFGPIKALDIPAINPLYRDCNGAFGSVVSFNSSRIDCVTTILTFELFVRYESTRDLLGAVEALKNKKLVYRDDDKRSMSASSKTTTAIDESGGIQSGHLFNAEIVIDFDRTKRLSESSIKKREAAIDEYYRKMREESEKEKKRKKSEEKLLEKLKLQELKRKEMEEKEQREIKKNIEIQKALKLSKQLAKDERKYLHAQRKVESIRLLSVLIDRLKHQEEEEIMRRKEQELEEARQKLLSEERSKFEAISLERARQQQRTKDDLLKKELELRERLMRKLIHHRHKEVLVESPQIDRRKKKKR